MTTTTTWTQAVHFIDPVTGNKMKPEHITARCGRIEKVELIKTTGNYTDVTCKKCLSYINNPYRTLRRYGRVKVLESFFVMLWSDYGYHLDVVAYSEIPGTWKIIIGRKSVPYSMRSITVTSMCDLGFKMLAIIEQEIKEFEYVPFNQNAPVS